MQLPLPIDGYNTWHFITDPLHDALLLYLKNIITTDIQPAWASQFDGYVVQSVIPFEPDPAIVKQLSIKKPLLSLYRTTSTFDEIAIGHQKETQIWQGYYIMPESTTLLRTKQRYILNAVKKALLSRTKDFDGPNLYDINLVNAEQQFWTASSPDGDNILNPTLGFQIETVEYAPCRILADGDVPYEGSYMDLQIWDQETGYNPISLMEIDASFEGD
jgi:hypothetical protein